MTYQHERDTEPTWPNQLKAAHALPDSELRRHALVSTSSRHRCEDCFCCAALTVLEERHRQLRNNPRDGSPVTTAEKERIIEAMEGN